MFLEKGVRRNGVNDKQRVTCVTLFWSYTDSHFGVQRVKIVILYGAAHRKNGENHAKGVYRARNVHPPIHWFCRVHLFVSEGMGSRKHARSCKEKRAKKEGQQH